MVFWCAPILHQLIWIKIPVVKILNGGIRGVPRQKIEKYFGVYDVISEK